MAQRTAQSDRYLAVGKIVGPHGIRGEVKVAVMTDFPERFRPGTRLFVGSPEAAMPVVVDASRPHKGMMLVKLATVQTRSEAESLRDQFMMILEEEAFPLGEHENYAHDLIGLAVETTEGMSLGHVVEILFTRANDVYVVQGPRGEILIPALREVVRKVELGGADEGPGKMVVDLPEGLLD